MFSFSALYLAAEGRELGDVTRDNEHHQCTGAPVRERPHQPYGDTGLFVVFTAVVVLDVRSRVGRGVSTGVGVGVGVASEKLQINYS